MENPNKLATSHKELLANMRIISNQIMNISHSTCYNDEKSIKLLKKLSNKQCDTINIFIKISNLLLKIVSIEDKVSEDKVKTKYKRDFTGIEKMFSNFSEVIKKAKEGE